MAPSTIRRAIGVVKDQTSIGLAKVAGNVDPELEVLIVKATSHDDDVANEKYLREIILKTSCNRPCAQACVGLIYRRLDKTRDWIVVLKSLMLLHRLVVDGDEVFKEEILYAFGKGGRMLNLSGFKDEAHSNSWDHTEFVRMYAMYLDEKINVMLSEKKNFVIGHWEWRESDIGGARRVRFHDDENVVEKWVEKKDATPIKEMEPERVLDRMKDLQRLLSLVLACRPKGMAKNDRMVLIALYPVVTESFKVYGDMCEGLSVLLNWFSKLDYLDCVKAFETYVNAAKLIDQLVDYYRWCKDMGVARSLEYPVVLKVTDDLLRSLEGFLKVKANGSLDGSEKIIEKYSTIKAEEPVPNTNAMKALPAPENYIPPPTIHKPLSNDPTPDLSQNQQKPQQERFTEDLVNLKDEGSAEDQGNKLALALFSGPITVSTDGSWETFSSEEEPQVTSAWQTMASEPGRADWELALVESASNLSKQKSEMAGGFDPLLLNGMYDQGAVRQHVSSTQLCGGSASSVALPLPGRNTMPVLALPAPDGTIQPINEDPFAASLAVPPPSYVQIADIERKQQLLMQEQLLWQQYGMQGQAKIGAAGYGSYGVGPPFMMPYGMQNSMRHPGEYP